MYVNNLFLFDVLWTLKFQIKKNNDLKQQNIPVQLPVYHNRSSRRNRHNPHLNQEEGYGSCWRYLCGAILTAAILAFLLWIIFDDGRAAKNETTWKYIENSHQFKAFSIKFALRIFSIQWNRWQNERTLEFWPYIFILFY